MGASHASADEHRLSGETAHANAASRGPVKRMPGGSLGTFFVLTYAVTWTCFISVATLAMPARRPLGALVVLVGAFAPGLVALSCCTLAYLISQSTFRCHV
jgi:hypothetical protein